jgi:hypothetical protein
MPYPGYTGSETELVVFNLVNPEKPQKISSIKLPELMPYYHYWCGGGGFWGGFWFSDYYNGYGSNDSWTVLDEGLVFLVQKTSYPNSDYQKQVFERKLVFLNLSNPAEPKLEEATLSNDSDLAFFNFVLDPTDQQKFYLSFRKKIKTIKKDNADFDVYRYYAQRWARVGNKWAPIVDINLPGRLMKTWTLGNERLFLTYEYIYQEQLQKNGTTEYPYWSQSFRLNLLRQLVKGNAVLGELVGKYWFEKLTLQDIAVDGSKLFINAQPLYYYGYGSSTEKVSSEEEALEKHSARLLIFDLGQLKMDKVHEAATGTSSVQIMGIHQGLLFINLTGDGLLAVNVNDPAHPFGQQFLRTLGWSTHIEFSENTAYVAAGHFGIYQMDLLSSSNMVTE